MTSNATAGSLAGVTVIDFGHYIAGPGAAMMLADHGADVIKITQPGVDTSKDGAQAVLNRGKRKIALDLKSPEGISAAIDLITTADVVIENFRPGVMERLGLGQNAMLAINPGLIYLSLPGFSAVDEEFAGLPAWEGIVAASMGQFTDMGLNRVLMGIEASYSPLSLASAYASVIGALSVTLALRARLKTGLGDHIEVPLAAALMEGLVYNSLSIENLPERYKSLRELEIERRRSNQLPMNLKYEDLQEFLDPFYRSYKCKDGRPFYVVSEAHATHSIRALQVLGLWEEMKAAGVPVADPYLSTSEWPEGVNCTLKAYPIAEPWAGYLSRRMAERFLTKDSFEWETLFGEAGAPAAAHRTTKEWLHSEHAHLSGLVMPVDDSELGDMLQPCPVAWLESEGGEFLINTCKQQSHRNLDSHYDLSSSSQPEESPIANAPWLSGITVLDMTNVIAGPTIAGTMTRFGARVIKLDSARPTFDPWNTVACGLYANLGKESILVDVKTAAGKEILLQLIRAVDVITINATGLQLESLGLTKQELEEVNERVILCHLDAFGGPKRGPRSNYPGYDDLVQASTGVMERFGGSMDTVEEHAHFGTIDVLAGFCGVFATAMALLQREKTGKGDIARTSLAAAGQWLQSRFMYDYEGRPPFNEARGRDVKGEGAWYRCYKAADGWFFLAALGLDPQSLTSSKLLAPASKIDKDKIEPWLEILFSTQTVEYWKEHLRELDIAVQPLESMANIRDSSIGNSPALNTVCFHKDSDHPSGRDIVHVAATAVRSARARLVSLPAAEKYGMSTGTILRELGYSQDQINELLHNGVVAESWSKQYLPD
ncbi:dimethylsulfoniopropionate cleavage enzyme DddD [Pseudomonas sp. NFR09]|uniref:CoA transferase n=1 Tax=Pseudomonas sp. NFR09 TaxID=1566249 RepID=UPI0008C67AEF|nr:CoA transferase [Pseudomonas sp. NFR09]SET63727.1 dimethylsulfoniopropionate cleavage enzyme DddD [Pseudomonas sp. NFR09]